MSVDNDKASRLDVALRTVAEILDEIEADAKQEAATFYRGAIAKLYAALGYDEGRCESCGRRIWWVITKNKARAPYTADGVSHFADCPKANQHRKSR